MSHVLYLHGFLSSPGSIKAQQTLSWCRAHRPDITLHIPQLSSYPARLKAQLEAYLTANPQLHKNGLKAIGSSMGGYLSTWLVERYGGKAVLINPAVRPYELLTGYLGDHINPYTQEAFTLIESDMDALRELDVASLAAPAHYKVLLQTGDETLDYRQAAEKYEESQLIVEKGGDHSFVGYPSHLPDIFAFLD